MMISENLPILIKKIRYDFNFVVLEQERLEGTAPPMLCHENLQ